MDRLWAPWRIQYVSAVAKRKKGCIFCVARKAVQHPAQSDGPVRTSVQKHAPSHPIGQEYVVFTTRHSLCMLNLYPYNNGHLMVAPLRHTDDLSSLSQAESADLWKALMQAQALLTKVLKPEGFNIGINIRRCAGAGIIGHVHVHIVPRWQGDTNFMPVIHEAKVVSQSLQELHRQLRDAYTKRHPSS